MDALLGVGIALAAGSIPAVLAHANHRRAVVSANLAAAWAHEAMLHRGLADRAALLRRVAAALPPAEAGPLGEAAEVLARLAAHEDAATCGGEPI